MRKIFSKNFYPYLTQTLNFFLVSYLTLGMAYGQTVIDELKAVSQGEVPIRDQVFSETITTISSNKRIFIVTNSNQKLFMGDFVTFIQDEELVLRALVVKTRDNKSGLKLVKIYKPNNWQALSTGANIQMIRGDDSYYQKQLNKERETVLNKDTTESTSSETAAPAPVEKNNLTADEQAILGNENVIENELPGDARKISANNLFYFSVGQFRSLGLDGSDNSYLHYRLGWGFQVVSNWWTDLSYGYTVLKKYPAQDIDTALNTFTGKFGYLFKLPVNSFLYTFGGFYNSIADSPGAGENRSSSAAAQQEIELVRDVEGSGYVFGVSYFKRLVPGWTFRIDFDNKLIAAGIMVEI